MHRRRVHLGRRYCAIAPQDRLGESSIRLALPLLEPIASYGTRFVVCNLRACHLQERPYNSRQEGGKKHYCFTLRAVVVSGIDHY